MITSMESFRETERKFGHLVFSRSPVPTYSIVSLLSPDYIRFCKDGDSSFMRTTGETKKV